MITKRTSALIFAILAVALIGQAYVPALAQHRNIPKLVTPLPGTSVQKPPAITGDDVTKDAPEYRASWVFGFGSEFASPAATTTLINTLADNNFNVVIPEIRKAGDAYYNSAYEPWASDIVGGYDPLADMLTKAHARGMEVYGWIVAYRIWQRNRAVPPSHIWAKHPEWAMTSNTGSINDGSYYDLDPGVPGAQQYICDVMKDCLSKYDLDGYNFDYIRYPTYTWGYNAISKERFRRAFGVDPPRYRITDPADPNYQLWQDWCEWRRQQVTDFVKKCYLEAIYIKPSIKMTVDTIGWMGGDPTTDFTQTRAYNDVFQDHQGWMMDHIIDLNILMNYKRDWTGLLAPTYRYKGYAFGNQQADHRLWSDYLAMMQDLSGRHSADGIGGYMNIMQGVLDQWGYSRSRYTFDPPARTYSNLNSDLPTEDYTGILQPNTVSGHALDSAEKPTQDAAVATSGGLRSATTGQEGSHVPMDVAQGAHGLAASKTGFTTSTDSNQRMESGDTLHEDSVLGYTSAVSTAPVVGSSNTVTFGNARSGLPGDTSPTGLRAPVELTNAGDFYYAADGRQIHLQRASNEAAVRYVAGVDPAHGLAQLQSAPGIPALERVSQVTYRTRSPIDVLRTSAASQRPDTVAMARQPSVAFAFPVLVDAASRCRMIPTDEVLARFPKGVSAYDQQSVISAAGLEIVEQTGNQSQNVYLLRLVVPKGSNPLDAANALARSGKVLWAQPNFMRETRHFSTPNDPMYPFQWNLHNTGQNGGVSDADVDAPEAWDVTTGSSSVTIAIIDDGVDTSHGDLNIAPGGWDFANNDSNPNPVGTNGHGTGCAGVAAAIINNGYRMAGMAGACGILPIKVFDDSGNWLSDQAGGNAITYAADRADVLSNSWGGGSPSAYIDDAVSYANTSGRGGKGCPVFFATGNSASKWNNGGSRVRLSTTGLSGNYYIGFCYGQGFTSSDENAVMIDDVCLLDSDGYTHKTSVLPSQGFEGGSFLPSGWSFYDADGTAQWYRTSTNAKSGTGGSYSVRSPSMSSGQYSTELLTPLLSLAGNETICFDLYSAASSNSYIWVDIYDAGKSYVGSWGSWCETPTVETSIAYPSSLSTSYAGTCAVGASTDCDRRSDYSEYGTGLDFLAPSNGGWNDIVTLDPRGTVGWNSTDYKMNFGGTSSACPLAAGVAALVLSKNPSLTAAEVRTTLRDSCEKKGPFEYSDGWNQYYGYGRINAASALELAPPLKVSGFVRTPALAGVAEVTMNVQPSIPAPITGADGYYEFAVPAGWNGTVTPSKTGYFFTPAHQSYANVVSSQSDQDYTAIRDACLLSGYVRTADGAPIAFVKMNGLPGSPAPKTNAAGYYSAYVPLGWSGTVTPARWHDVGLCMYRYGFDVGLEDPYAPGLPIFSSGNVVAPGSETMFYNTIKSTMFQNPAPVPEMPWKTNPTTGYLFGQVTDALEPNDPIYQNWIYQGVVTATGPGTSKDVYTEMTDATGTYGFIDLPPGNYAITVTATGFNPTSVLAATVVKGRAAKVNVVLGPVIPPENYKTLAAANDPTQTPDGTVIGLNGKAITSPTAALSDCIYVEETDRSSGLQVRPGGASPPVAEGDLADLIGIMTTVNGERVLNHAAALTRTPGTPLGALGSKIQDLSRAPRSTALLVKIAGKVTDMGVGWFALSDGSGTIKVKCPGMVAPARGLAVQVSGINALDPTERVIRVRKQSDINVLAKSVVTAPSGTIGVGLDLFSMPYVPMDPSPGTTLTGLNISGRLFRWDNASQAFIAYDPIQPVVFGSLCPYEGYALLATAAGTISFEGIPIPTVDARISLVKRGWSLIANPFNAPILWEHVSVTDGNRTLSLRDAYAAGWIGRIAFTWDNQAGNFGYVGTGARGSRFDDSLRPWKAYWAATYQDGLALIIPAGG